MKMTVRQVIARLEEVAEGLPRGLDTPLITMLCDGTNAEGSWELEIDNLVWYEGSQATSAAAMIKGHPHIDRAEGRDTAFPGMASNADEALREWTEGQADEGDGEG